MAVWDLMGGLRGGRVCVCVCEGSEHVHLPAVVFEPPLFLFTRSSTALTEKEGTYIGAAGE